MNDNIQYAALKRKMSRNRLMIIITIINILELNKIIIKAYLYT